MEHGLGIFNWIALLQSTIDIHRRPAPKHGLFPKNGFHACENEDGDRIQDQWSRQKLMVATHASGCLECQSILRWDDQWRTSDHVEDCPICYTLVVKVEVAEYATREWGSGKRRKDYKAELLQEFAQILESSGAEKTMT